MVWSMTVHVFSNFRPFHSVSNCSWKFIFYFKFSENFDIFAHMKQAVSSTCLYLDSLYCKTEIFAQGKLWRFRADRQIKHLWINFEKKICLFFFILFLIYKTIGWIKRSSIDKSKMVNELIQYIWCIGDALKNL